MLRGRETLFEPEKNYYEPARMSNSFNVLLNVKVMNIKTNAVN